MAFVVHTRYGRRMSVKHSLLAILSDGAAYGYQLKTEFERRTASTWPLNIGQVYTTLDRLVRDGLATPGDRDADGRAHYAITDAGRRELASWFATPIEVGQPPRNDLAIKLALAMTMADVDVPGIIQRQRTATMATLQHYTLAKRQADPDDVAWLMVVELMIFTAEAEARWLDHCEVAIKRGPRPRRPLGRGAEPHPADPHTAEPRPTETGGVR